MASVTYTTPTFPKHRSAAAGDGPGQIGVQDRPLAGPQAGDMPFHRPTVGVRGSGDHRHRQGGVLDSVDPSRLGRRVTTESRRPDPYSAGTGSRQHNPNGCLLTRAAEALDSDGAPGTVKPVVNVS
jgi:L-iditol 2-dehydrogenase